MADIVGDGFKMLDAMTLAELDRRIDFLEETLEVYRLLRNVKKISERIDIPEEFVSRTKPAVSRKTIPEEIVEFMQTRPGRAVTCEDIQQALPHRSRKSISATMSQKKNLFLSPRRGLWCLKVHGENQEVVADILRTEGAA